MMKNSDVLLEKTFRKRLVNIISSIFMPMIGQLTFSDKANTFLWRMLGAKIGLGSVIRRGSIITSPFDLEVGKNCIVHGSLLSRGGITLGDYVELVQNVVISSQSHDVRSPIFKPIYRPVLIGDFCWLSINSIVLQGVTLSEGCIVSAGAIVTKSEKNQYSIIAGIPGKKVGIRETLDKESYFPNR